MRDEYLSNAKIFIVEKNTDILSRHVVSFESLWSLATFHIKHGSFIVLYLLFLKALKEVKTKGWIG